MHICPFRQSALMFLATLIFCVSIGAQTMSSDDVRVAADWQPGESRKYLFTLDSEYSVFMHPKAQIDSADYLVTITVIDRSEEGFTLEWLYEGITGKGSTTDWPLSCLANGLRIRYMADPRGAFLRILNWHDIADYLSQSLGVVVEPDSGGRGGMVYHAATCSFASREDLESYGLRDIKLFHALYGYKASDEGSFYFTQNAWNQINEEPSELVSYPELSFHSTEEHEARFEASGNYQLAPDSGYLFDVESEVEFDLRLDTGWPLFAYSSVTSTRGDIFQRDTILLRHTD